MQPDEGSNAVMAQRLEYSHRVGDYTYTGWGLGWQGGYALSFTFCHPRSLGLPANALGREWLQALLFGILSINLAADTGSSIARLANRMRKERLRGKSKASRMTKERF